jgi:hypothetical protein
MNDDAPQSDLEAQIAALARDLGSWRRARREAAISALRAMVPMDVEAVISIYQREQQRMLRLYGIMGVCWLGLMLTQAIPVIIRLFHPGYPRNEYPWILLTWILMTLAGICLAIRPFTTTGARRKYSLIQLLSDRDDLRIIGPLCDTLNPYRLDFDPVVIAALKRLLPRLKASDAGLLNPDQRKGLYAALNTYIGKGIQFHLAVLQAIEQVGDSGAIPHVERIAYSEAATVNEKQLREAARECLQSLKARAEQERLSRTLLRLASAPDSPAETLLRPAQGAPEADPNRLLRPAVPED